VTASPSTGRAYDRAVRVRARALERARLAKLERAARRRAAVIGDELAKPRACDCACAINAQSTIEELRGLGAGCTAGRWVCPTLDAIRRRLP